MPPLNGRSYNEREMFWVNDHGQYDFQDKASFGGNFCRACSFRYCFHCCSLAIRTVVVPRQYRQRIEPSRRQPAEQCGPALSDGNDHNGAGQRINAFLGVRSEHESRRAWAATGICRQHRPGQDLGPLPGRQGAVLCQRHSAPFGCSTVAAQLIGYGFFPAICIDLGPGAFPGAIDPVL